MENDKMVLFLL